MSNDPRKPITGASLMGNPDIKAFFNQAPTPLPAPIAVQAPPPPEKIDPVDEMAEAVVAQISTKTPEEKYLADLERLGVSKEEAAKIVDSMIFTNSYEEYVQVTKKLKVKFRTRDQDAIDRLNIAIDKLNPQFSGSLYSLVAEYNLSHSLAEYGPNVFNAKTDDGFEQVHKYVKSLPTPVFQLLASKLSKFDEKLTTIMADGVVENFF